MVKSITYKIEDRPHYSLNAFTDVTQPVIFVTFHTLLVRLYNPFASASAAKRTIFWTQLRYAVRTLLYCISYFSFLKPSITQYVILTKTNVVTLINIAIIGNSIKASLLEIPYELSKNSISHNAKYVMVRLKSDIDIANLLKPGWSFSFIVFL